MIDQPEKGSYRAAALALYWLEDNTDARTYEALETILAHVHRIDERLQNTLEVNHLWDGS